MTPPATSSTLKGFFIRTAALVENWLSISRQRRALARLDDRMLRDIGVSRASANRESNRPFWDLPDYQLPESPRSRHEARRARRYRGPQHASV